jgi:hypothetical protein
MTDRAKARRLSFRIYLQECRTCSDALPSQPSLGFASFARNEQYGTVLASQPDAFDSSLHRRIVWTLRSSARRERDLERDDRRLTDPELRTWRAFAGRLHEGDLVSLVVENNAERNPLALRPLDRPIDASTGKALLHEALAQERHLLAASSATFLEAAATAFGRPALGEKRRAAFEPIRSFEQRILEFPSTAARVAAMVAPAGAPLETYVGYVVADEDDAFLVGLAMLEFDRNTAPTLLRAADLEARALGRTGTFSRAVSLGGDDALIALVPESVVSRERIFVI